ncbi:MAG: hypothetical protein ACRDI2_16085 [Chloroflexota bacterium]
MSDRTLPTWLRLILVGTALMQAIFAVTLLAHPEAIDGVWPWRLSPAAARLLGASTVVSVVLSLLAAAVDRWSAARIPIVMLLTYRVLQLLAGVLHIERFDFTRPVTWNYFGGGGLMLLILAYALVRGHTLGRPAAPDRLGGDLPLALGSAGVFILRAIAVIYFAVGLTYLVLGAQAAWLWFEAPGVLTPLTARLFASPMTGLALGLWLITRATYWREVANPAAGMATFGLAGSLALALEVSRIQPPTAAGYLTAATPAMLLLIGVFLLAQGRRGLRTVNQATVARP